jgi:hypothetical protein
MDVFIMYLLMIVDLTWTLMHHSQAGELNPLFSRLLSNNEVQFVYIKLAANSIAAFIVIYLEKVRPIIGHVLAIFGILVYGIVVWLHWFVDYSFAHADKLQDSVIWGMIHAH